MPQDLFALVTLNAWPAVLLVTFAARVGLPVPAALLLVAAGALGHSARAPLAPVAIASVLANLAGDAVWFAAGKVWGHRVLRVVCRVSLSPDACVRQSEDLIVRWGGSSLVAAKFIPGVSVIAAPMAGALGMGWLRFAAYGVLSGAVWTLVFLGTGVVFRDDIHRVLHLLAEGGTVGGALLGALLLAFAAYRWQRRRALRDAASVPRIGVGELRALMDSGHAPLIVDVRAQGSMRVDPRRVPGAVKVDLARIEAFARGIPRGREVVVYCNCPDDVSAAQAAVLLARAGVRRVRPLSGGLDAWFAEDAAGGKPGRRAPPGSLPS